MANTIFWVWLAECLGAGSRDVEPLMQVFGSAEEVFEAGVEAYYRLPGVNEDALERLSAGHDLAHAEHIVRECTRLGIGIITYGDDTYPPALRALPDPPAVLYYRGRMPDFARQVAVAVVGTRSMTDYGARTAYRIGYELASAGVVVVAGMALGIDSVAHAAAIRAGGETLAVLGSGLDVIYPAEHRALYDRILAHGAVVSEYPPGTRAIGAHFPVRNRLISALSLGTVIVEADLRSGAMITARRALTQGKDLFAVPGEVGSFHAAGANELLHAGANMVLSAQDILDHYKFLYRSAINMQAYAASVEHAVYDPAILDEMGVGSRDSDYKLTHRTPKDARKDTPAPSPKPPRRDRLPGELRARSKPSPVPAPAPPPKPASKPASKPIPTPSATTTVDAATASLSDSARRVYEHIPDDRATSTDTLMATGLSPAEVIAALTELELSGLVLSMPGSLYIRA